MGAGPGRILRQRPVRVPEAPTRNGGLPGLVATEWLARNLERSDVRVIDVRAQPAYNTSHIPGLVCLSPESFRGVFGGVSSMLLPAEMLGKHLALIGIRPEDTVALVPSEKMHDATTVAIGLERLGHRRYGILEGGFGQWVEENRPVTTALPDVASAAYAPRAGADRFTVEYQTVLAYVRSRRAVILDVRPSAYYAGMKTDEARAGHIPGAINRPFSEDVRVVTESVVFKTVDELEKAYSALIPSKDATIVIHCRTGHQASQTFFVLKHLLDYRNVLWYDAGWSEWAARSALPIETRDVSR